LKAWFKGVGISSPYVTSKKRRTVKGRKNKFIFQTHALSVASDRGSSSVFGLSINKSFTVKKSALFILE
jgi:hypothetical protein